MWVFACPLQAPLYEQVRRGLAEQAAEQPDAREWLQAEMAEAEEAHDDSLLTRALRSLTAQEKALEELRLGGFMLFGVLLARAGRRGTLPVLACALTLALLPQVLALLHFAPVEMWPLNLLLKGWAYLFAR